MLEVWGLGCWCQVEVELMIYAAAHDDLVVSAYPPS